MRARSLACTRLVLMLTALLMVATAATPGLPVADVAASVDRGVGGQAALVAADAVRPAGVPAPQVIPRTEWDPRGTCPVSTGDRTAPHRITVHHTHAPVVESRGEVPRAMRLICKAHRARGFDEIGYHYAVDPFGRVWQGRGPLPSDITRRVRNGAHAQGFNDNAIGVVFIGDFQDVKPTRAAVQAAADLMAFLADQYDIDPASTVPAVSTGGSKTRYPTGTRVVLPAIDGHRDTGAGTLCPGRRLYALLPYLRRVRGRAPGRRRGLSPLTPGRPASPTPPTTSRRRGRSRRARRRSAP